MPVHLFVQAFDMTTASPENKQKPQTALSASSSPSDYHNPFRSLNKRYNRFDCLDVSVWLTMIFLNCV